MDSDRIVSSEAEQLILVDDHDNEIGFASKADCHNGAGTLHRAFSVFLFNPDGELLLQRRASGKRLWPGFWSNSCCSHPRAGEDIADAVRRRAREELGMDVEAQYLYKFQYSATYLDVGQENELCSVFVAYSDTAPQPNPNEIEDCRYVAASELERLIESNPDDYTPWFRQEWQTLMRDFAGRFEPGQR